MSDLIQPVPGVLFGPWPADREVALLTFRPPPSVTRRSMLAATLDVVREHGYRRIITGALMNGEQLPFKELGFSVSATLRVLSRRVRTRLPRVETNVVPWPPESLEVLRAVDEAAFSPYWHFGTRGFTEAMAMTRRRRLRVVLADSQPVGFALTGLSGSHGYLQRIAVRPDAQRHGVGSALLADSLRWLRRSGARDVAVNTQADNDVAYAMYLRFGFQLTKDDLAILERDL